MLVTSIVIAVSSALGVLVPILVVCWRLGREIGGMTKTLDDLEKCVKNHIETRLGDLVEESAKHTICLENFGKRLDKLEKAVNGKNEKKKAQ